VGLVLGVTRRPLADTYNGWENPYVLLPVSVTAGDFTVHVQPGWLRNRESRREETIWGVAGEWNASDRFTLLAEAFGVSSERPFVRAGVRWVAIKDRLEFDLSWVTRSGGAREDRFASLGLTWTSAAFLP